MADLLFKIRHCMNIEGVVRKKTNQVLQGTDEKHFSLKGDSVTAIPALAKLVTSLFRHTEERHFYSDTELLAAAVAKAVLQEKPMITKGEKGKVCVRLGEQGERVELTLDFDHATLSRQMGFGLGTWLRGLWNWWQED